MLVWERRFGDWLLLTFIYSPKAICLVKLRISAAQRQQNVSKAAKLPLSGVYGQGKGERSRPRTLRHALRRPSSALRWREQNVPLDDASSSTRRTLEYLTALESTPSAFALMAQPRKVAYLLEGGSIATTYLGAVPPRSTSPMRSQQRKLERRNPERRPRMWELVQ